MIWFFIFLQNVLMMRSVSSKMLVNSAVSSAFFVERSLKSYNMLPDWETVLSSSFSLLSDFFFRWRFLKNVICCSPMSLTTGSRLAWSVDKKTRTDSKATFTGREVMFEELEGIESVSKRTHLFVTVGRDADPLFMILSLDLS